MIRMWYTGGIYSLEPYFVPREIFKFDKNVSVVYGDMGKARRGDGLSKPETIELTVNRSFSTPQQLKDFVDSINGIMSVVYLFDYYGKTRDIQKAVFSWKYGNDFRSLEGVLTLYPKYTYYN